MVYPINCTVNNGMNYKNWEMTVKSFGGRPTFYKTDRGCEGSSYITPINEHTVCTIVRTSSINAAARENMAHGLLK